MKIDNLQLSDNVFESHCGIWTVLSQRCLEIKADIPATPNLLLSQPLHTALILCTVFFAVFISVTLALFIVSNKKDN